VGVKPAITGAMQSGTLVALPQSGGSGTDGLAKPGFTPKVSFGPKENPVLAS
jgi:hypothetical protein